MRSWRNERIDGLCRGTARRAPTKGLRAMAAMLVAPALIAGCARAPVVPSVPHVPAALTAEELVSVLREREAAIRTMKAQFSVVATGASIKGIHHMEAALVFQRPGSVRLQTFARMGVPVFDLVLVDGHYQIKIPLQGKSHKGNVADLDRQGVLGTPIVLGLRAMLGNLSNFPVSSTDHVGLREENSQYVLDVYPTEVGKVGVRRLWIDRRTLEIVRHDYLGESGEVQARITFQDYRQVGVISGRPLSRPYLVRAEEVRGQTKLVLTFHEIIPNPDLTPLDWGVSGSEPTADLTGMKGEG